MKTMKRLLVVLAGLAMTSGCESLGGFLEGAVIGCQASGCYAESE